MKQEVSRFKTDFDFPRFHYFAPDRVSTQNIEFVDLINQLFSIFFVLVVLSGRFQ